LKIAIKSQQTNFSFYKVFPVFDSQQWLLDKQDLIRERQHDLLVLTEEEYQKIFIFFSSSKLK